MNYEVEYVLMGRMHTTYVDRLSDAKDGFWVNREGQFSKASEVHAFILPHMINYIIKI